MRQVLSLALAAAAAITILGCGETEEALQSGTPLPTTAPEATPSPTAEATPSPDQTDTVTSTPAPQWQAYSDPILGFSLEYPPDMTYMDSGPITSAGVERRILQFQATPGPNGPRFAISMTDNSEDLTLEEWLQFTACLPETVEEGTIGGQPALFCTALPEEIPEAAALFAHHGTMFYITSIFMAPAEFERLIESIELDDIGGKS